MSLEAIGIVSERVAKSVEFDKLLGVELKKLGDEDHYDGVTSGGRGSWWTR